MKFTVLALLIVLIVSQNQAWDVVSSLPSCYTGLPFNLELGTGNSKYSYKSKNLPSYCTLDEKRGVISGRSEKADARTIHVEVSNGRTTITRQYIINVIDTKSASNDVWATKTDNYYERKVANPFQIVANVNAITTLYVGDNFNYQFQTKNAVGTPVYAFLNLPGGLNGDVNKGAITGTFSASGVYTLGVECADQAGNTAEGFVTVTVSTKNSGSSSGVAVLNTVTVQNNVPFVFNIESVHQQQIEADKLLFQALAAVNAAKADLATRQGLYDNLNAQLSAAEANADKAAVNAAAANTNREQAAQRLLKTNAALNDAEDQLNLALLYQAGTQANLKKAEVALTKAQDTFNQAQTKLAEAENALQKAQADLNAKKLAEIQAATALQNAQKDFNRANQDLNEAKNQLSKAIDVQQQAELDVTRAKNDLTLAKQAYAQASKELDEANRALAKAQAARQAALKVLQDATIDNQKATAVLGSAQWDLNQAIAALNVANAAKDAADRTSALVIANGSPQPGTQVDTKSKFDQCKRTDLPIYWGSVKVTKVYSGRCLLSTGNTLLYGSCTEGAHHIVEGQTITIKGVINPSSQCIEARSVSLAAYK